MLVAVVGSYSQMFAQSSGKKQAVNDRVVKFRTFRYTDNKVMHMEAFHVLIPEGWKFTGGIYWQLTNPGMPAVLSFKVKNPKNREEFEVFPDQSFFWTNNPMFFESFPVGSMYYGNEVRRPAGAVSALENIVLPRFRENVRNLKIISEQELPGLARKVEEGQERAQGVSATADAAKIRVEYQENGIWMDEDIYGVVELSESSATNIYTTIKMDKWVLDYLFSFKAEKGKLDSHNKLFQTIAYSFRLNPQWFNKYYQLIGMLSRMQIRQIQSIGEISNMISQTSNQISDMVMKSYNYQQNVNNKVFDNFCQSILGVNKYYNSLEGKSVELPEGYKKVWANSLGEYILSDNPNYNPNVGSNLHWKQISKE